MHRFLLIAGSALVLTACGTMDGMTQHHTPYAKLGKIAKESDAQMALLVTREGDIVGINVATGKILKPSAEQKPLTEENDSRHSSDAATEASISPEKFAEIKRRFERTINIKVTKGSICLEGIPTPPGIPMRICTPPDPQWW